MPTVSFVRVPKRHLVLLAGVVWCLAGAMVAIVGLPLELRLAPTQVALIPLALAVFLAFDGLVFARLVHKHTGRIRARREERLPAYEFFNAPSWIVMAVMMGGGMMLRSSHQVPDWAIAFFYSGLGIALFLAGLRFLTVFARWDAAGEPEAGSPSPRRAPRRSAPVGSGRLPRQPGQKGRLP